MRLSDLELQGFYSSSSSHLIDDFYVPVLNRATRYDRAVGYFSSAIFVIIESAVSGFVSRGGKIRLICSPHLSEEDAEAIAEPITEEEISGALETELNTWDASVGSRAPSSLLRRLIARGAIEMKIAVTWNRRGIFHAKIGIFEDLDGNAVAFSGSVNETASGWSIYLNHEQIEVFSSWLPKDVDRVRRLKLEFDEYWNGLARNLKMLPASRLKEVFEPRPEDLEEEEALRQFANMRAFRRPSIELKGVSKPKDLQDHQKLALENWSAQGRRGIIAFVTGGGKTVTAISAIREWLKMGKPVLVLVPSDLLHRQWEEEMRSELAAEQIDLVRVGAGTPLKVWSSTLRNALEFHENETRTVILSTYDSARHKIFSDLLRGVQSDLLVVADEVHRIGATKNQKLIENIDASARLGLSATPERYGDPAGTQKIANYFGATVEPKFSIQDAITAGRLVPYQYWIHEVSLDPIEEEEFEKLTQMIRRQAAISERDGQRSKSLDALLRRRARIVKESSAKATLACQIIRRDYRGSGHWLVYCNSRNQMDIVQAELRKEKVDCLQYHSALAKPRHETIEYFMREGGILLAIKCLDEGIDIPVLDTAIILASTTNPREYIQRRGRILRWSPHKHAATLHDVVVEREDGTVALKSDLGRSLEIASGAENSELILGRLRYIISRTSKDPVLDAESEDEDENEDGE